MQRSTECFRIARGLIRQKYLAELRLPSIREAVTAIAVMKPEPARDYVIGWIGAGFTTSDRAIDCDGLADVVVRYEQYEKTQAIEALQLAFERKDIQI